ncbi:MAG: CDP-alcohol phosphatidyltransferase family protein [Clostridia bacterium]|nr:CDP-alcohol phosphatidyltransferase family protein [Clostridia bacterium]
MKAKYIPNILSVIRIILSFAFAAVFVWWYPDGVLWAAVIFVVAGLSDVVDGILARRFGWITDAGKLLDPIADKLMQCVSLICLVAREILPIWILIVVLIKEILMGCGAIVLFKKSHEIGVAKNYGKAYTVLFYAVVFLFLCFGNIIKENIIATFVLCAAMAALGLGAVVLYYISYLKNKMTGKGGDN